MQSAPEPRDSLAGTSSNRDSKNPADLSRPFSAPLHERLPSPVIRASIGQASCNLQTGNSVGNSVGTPGLRIRKTTLTVAKSGAVAASTNAGKYEKWSTSHPTSSVNSVPVNPAERPLNPVTDPTTSGGNKSE